MNPKSQQNCSTQWRFRPRNVSCMEQSHLPNLDFEEEGEHWFLSISPQTWLDDKSFWHFHGNINLYWHPKTLCGHPLMLEQHKVPTMGMKVLLTLFHLPYYLTLLEWDDLQLQKIMEPMGILVLRIFELEKVKWHHIKKYCIIEHPPPFPQCIENWEICSPTPICMQ